MMRSKRFSVVISLCLTILMMFLPVFALHTFEIQHKPDFIVYWDRISREWTTNGSYHCDYVVVGNRLAVFARKFQTVDSTRYLLDAYLDKKYQENVPYLKSVSYNVITLSGNLSEEYEWALCSWFIPYGQKCIEYLIMADDEGNLSLYHFESFVTDYSMETSSSKSPELLDELKNNFPAAIEFGPYDDSDVELLIMNHKK